MTQPNESSVAVSIHALVDWVQARLAERESWDGVTLIILSLLILTVSSLIVYVAWAGIAYGGWLIWRKGTWKRIAPRDNSGPY